MGLFTPYKCSGSSPNIKTELRTSPNIRFLAKTELRTSRTSQKTEQFANIELFVPPLLAIYVLDFHKFFSDGLEDPLEDVGMVTQQLDQISVIGR